MHVVSTHTLLFPYSDRKVITYFNVSEEVIGLFTIIYLCASQSKKKKDEGKWYGDIIIIVITIITFFEYVIILSFFMCFLRSSIKNN